MLLALLAIPTLWLVGDSTVHNGNDVGKGKQIGWGEPLKEMFDPEKIAVVNRAIGGRSSRTFQTEGRWDKVLAEAKPGDYVLIQFGHNDPAALNDETRARGTIRGTGEETEEIDNLLTKKHETVHSYGWYMRKYARDAKEHGLKPILVTYVPRCPKPDAKPDPDPAPTSYRLWAQEVAKAEGVPCLDLYGRVWSVYAKLAPVEVDAKYFGVGDLTHTSLAGAILNAQKVAEGLRAMPELPLGGWLKAESR